jgi:hypothetical protein
MLNRFMHFFITELLLLDLYPNIEIQTTMARSPRAAAPISIADRRSGRPTMPPSLTLVVRSALANHGLLLG